MNANTIFTKANLLISLLFLFLLVASCKRNRNIWGIPEIFVDEIILVNNPSNFNLTIQGGYVYREGGFLGLLIYRRYINNAQDDFAAYELACPAHWEDDCRMEVVDEIYLECECHQHQFLLFDGSTLSDESPLPVKQYRVVYDGFNQLRVTNR